MRTRQLAAILAAVTWSCAGSEPTATLTVTPATAAASGPVLIQAGPASVAGGVTWSLSGAGSLSDTKGPQTVYRPPSPAPSTGQSATVTATLANGQSATSTLTLSPPAQAPAVITSLKGNVSVTYDAQDIPHIFCGNALDCFAVQGYIQAQDRLFQMDLFRRTARGQLASLIGPLQVSSDVQFLTLFVTRDGKRIEDKLVAALDPDTKAKLVAFSDGVNAYLNFLLAHPTLMPGEYAQLPQVTAPGDIPPWTPQDSLALGRLQQFQLSETLQKETAFGLFASTFAAGPSPKDPARFATYVRAQQPLPGYTLSVTDAPPVTPTAPINPSLAAPAASAVAAPAAAAAPAGAGVAAPAATPDLSSWRDNLAELNASMQEMHALFGSLHLGDGSNNWVIDGKHSATGKALVANDPHLSLQYPPLFHLAALTATDSSGLNLVGGAFPGVPGALIGRGAHVGWGVTVVGYDVTDLYLEQVVPSSTPGCPSPVGCVLFNGGLVGLLPVQYKQIKVHGAADASTTVFVVPHHGPLVSFNQTTGKAISMRWTGHETTADLKAFLGLNVATAVGDGTGAAGTAFGALKDYATGAQNFVLADDAGNIGYDPHALVPRRDWAGSSLTLLPWLPLPGDGTAEWGAAIGATGAAITRCAPAGGVAPPADCWVPDNLLPQGVNPAKGYFATANSDPAGYTGSSTAPFGSTAPAGLYPYLSFDWDDPTDLRYARIATRLKALTTGAGKVAVTDMQSVQSDHSVLLAKLVDAFLPATPPLPAAQATAYAGALQLLTAWGADDYDCPTGLTTADPKSAVDPDPKHNRDSAACLLFHTMLQNLLHSVFDDDFAVVTATTGSSFGGDGGAEIRALLFMLGLPASDPHTSFCNDVRPDNSVAATHTCTDKLVTSLLVAAGTLQAAYGAPANWIWGRVHTLTTTSAAAPLIAGAFAAGPFARPGGAFTVDVGNPDGSQASLLGFTYSHGSNVRFIAELGDPAAAVTKMQLPGPERDAPFGVFSNTPNLLGQYVQNQYFDFALGHQVDANAVSVQGFTAQ